MPLPLLITIVVLSVLVFLGLSSLIVFPFIVSYIVYSKTLVRVDGKTWGRQISEPGNEELETMWKDGCKWASKNKEYKKDLTITSDNLKLVAEYYDFGNKKTVIILPGRRECLMYSYYYANPYKDVGVNVLVVDQRAHGLSEGKYSTCGIREAIDVNKWAELLNKEYGQEEIILHGVCVGTACSINVLKRDDAPSYFKGVILDSTPITYKEIYGNHMLELGHKLGFTYRLIWWWFKKKTGQNIDESAPLDNIDKIKVPTCLMFARLDKYCLPEKSEWLIKKCNPSYKEVSWFEQAGHSKIRLSEPDRYDQIIKSFINKI